MTKLKMLAALFGLIAFAPVVASALTHDQAASECAKYKGHMQWNWSSLCPWCFQTCLSCWSENYCLIIICDLKQCDDIIVNRRAGRPPRTFVNPRALPTIR
jgi:hypothetical protein